MAVAVAMAGMDPMEFLMTTDELQRSLMQSIAYRYRDVSQVTDQNRAIQIANAVGKMLSGK